MEKGGRSGSRRSRVKSRKHIVVVNDIGFKGVADSVEIGAKTHFRPGLKVKATEDRERGICPASPVHPYAEPISRNDEGLPRGRIKVENICLASITIECQWAEKIALIGVVHAVTIRADDHGFGVIVTPPLEKAIASIMKVIGVQLIHIIRRHAIGQHANEIT